jgi:integrase
MGVFLRGRWYWYRRMIDGHRVYRSLKIKRGQEAMLSGRMRQVDDEITAAHFGLPAPARGAVRFSQYVESYIKQKKHNKSVYQLKHRLGIVWRLWPDLPLGQYSPAHVRELEAALFERKLKPATVNRYMELLRNLWNCAIEDGAATANPIRAYQPFAEEGERRALSDDELGRIIDVARRMTEKPLNGIQAVFLDMALLSLATGMRLGLIVNLRREYVREDLLVVPISQTKSKRRGAGMGHGEKVKVIVLSPLAQEIIGRQVSKDDYVFPLRWRNSNAIGLTVLKIRKEANVPDFTFHQFRHTASTFVGEHSSLAVAKAILGHADLKTTLRYTHPGLAEQRASVAKLATHLEELTRKGLINKGDAEKVG